MDQIKKNFITIARNYKSFTDKIALMYNKANIVKKGKIREIYIPNPQLKEIQRIINKIFQANLPKPTYLHTGYKKCRIINVLKCHKASRLAVILDIKDFYGSVKGERIFHFLQRTCNLNVEDTKTIFKLVTYNNRLPLGLPTSNIISFWSCKEIFDDIYNYCEKLGYKFTLYADDMVISGDIKDPVNVISRVQKTLKRADLSLNYKKIKIYGKKKRIMNVHISKNGKLSVDNKLNNAIHILQKRDDLNEYEQRSLHGMLKYKKYIEKR